MGSKKEIMRKQEFIAWIVNETREEVGRMSRPSKGMFLKSLRDNPINQMISICSEIYNWKIRAEDDTGLTVEQMGEDEGQSIAQQVVDKLSDIFSAEIDALRG